MTEGHGMERTIDWRTTDGRQAALTLTVRYELTRQGRERRGGRLEIATQLSLDGHVDPTALWVQPVTGHPVAVARCGRVGLTAETYRRVMDATQAIEEAIADHNAAIDAHAAALDEVDDERRRLESIL